MIKHNQNGAVSGVVISLVFTVLLLIGALVFGFWAYGQRQDYKTNSDAKSAVAVAEAVKKEDAKKDAEAAEAAKNPLATYAGPSAYGSLVIKYPKTWSGYVSATGQNSGALVDGYFAPGVVPSITDPASVFALRVQVVNSPYAQTVQTFSAQQKAGKLTAAAYALPKLPSVTGLKVTGQAPNKPEGSSVTMVVLPLRSQTIEIWTEGNQYLDDFNNNILPNFSFSP